MEATILWNLVLTILIGAVAFFMSSKFRELDRISILLNRTREEIAKEYITKNDVHGDINRVLTRLDRLDEKLDAFMKEQRSALG